MISGMSVRSAKGCEYEIQVASEVSDLGAEDDAVRPERMQKVKNALLLMSSSSHPPSLAKPLNEVIH